MQYPGAGNDISLGDIKLVTLSGKGCKDRSDLVKEAKCFKDQVKTNYNLKVNVKARDGSPLEAPVKIEILKTHSKNGD